MCVLGVAEGFDNISQGERRQTFALATELLPLIEERVGQFPSDSAESVDEFSKRWNTAVDMAGTNQVKANTKLVLKKSVRFLLEVLNYKST